MQKKGQAAMEFLMTYGWAILAAIIVIGVLVIYFRPSTLTQSNVVVTAPLYGVGTTISSSQIQIEVRNNGGETITTQSGSLSFNNPFGAGCGAASGTGSVAAGATQILTFGSCNMSGGNTVSADVTITYTRPNSNLAQSSTGTLSGRVP